MVAYRNPGTEIFQVLALKVVAVAYERWLLTIVSKYHDLTWKRLVFGTLVTEERWSRPEFGQYSGKLAV